MPRLIIICLSLCLLGACGPGPQEDGGPRHQAAAWTAENPADYEIPTLTPLDNGNIVVRFKKSGCSVLFDHDGKLLEGGQMCDDVDLHRARQAVKAHIAERESDFLDV